MLDGIDAVKSLAIGHRDGDGWAEIFAATEDEVRWFRNTLGHD